jgi:type II/III secretion system protein
MRTRITFGLLASIIFVTAAALAQRTAAPQTEATKAAETNQLVTIEVLMIQVGASGEGAKTPPVRSAATIVDLDKQGKLDRTVRIRMSTVERQPATVQLGERVPVATSRNSIGGRGRVGFSNTVPREGREPPRDPPRDVPADDSTFTYAYTMFNVGTLISATPRVDDSGSILLDFKTEQSRLADTPRREGDIPGEAWAQRQRTVTINSQSTLRLTPGEPALVDAIQTSGDNQSSGEFIVVTAHLDDSPAGRRAAVDAPIAETRIFALTSANARDAVKVLQQLFANSQVRLTADERTNSVLAHGQRGKIQEMEAILQRLDEAGATATEAKK